MQGTPQELSSKTQLNKKNSVGFDMKITLHTTITITHHKLNVGKYLTGFPKKHFNFVFLNISKSK